MKKLGFYFKKGFVLAKMVMKGKSLFAKLLLGLYLILSFFGKFFLFLRPIFLIADNNLAMMIVEGHDFEINKLFEGINTKKRYSSLLLASLFVEGIALIGIVVMVVPFLIWFMSGLYNPAIPPVIFLIIFAVAAFVLVIALQVVYSPMGYVTCKGKDLNAGDVLYLAKEGSAKARGKAVGIYVFNGLFIVLFIALFILIPVLLASFMRDGSGFVSIFANFAILIFAIAFIFLDIFAFYIFRLSAKIALYSLFFDSAETKHIVMAKKENGKDEYVPLFTDDKEVKENA